jgi:hypothetical protein
MGNQAGSCYTFQAGSCYTFTPMTRLEIAQRAKRRAKCSLDDAKRALAVAENELGLAEGAARAANPCTCKTQCPTCGGTV